MRNLHFPNLLSIAPLFSGSPSNIYINITFENIDIPNKVSFESLFRNHRLNLLFNNITIPNVESLYKMIDHEYAQNITLSNIYAPNVVNVEYIACYQGCPRTYLYFKNINFSKLETMERIFKKGVFHITFDNIYVPNLQCLGPMAVSISYVCYKNIDFPKIYYFDLVIQYTSEVFFINTFLIFKEKL